MEPTRSRKIHQVLSLLFAVSFCLLSACRSNEEIVESTHTFPSWVSDIEPGYIVARGVGKDFLEAKESALQNVRKQITAQIAQFIYIREGVTTINDVNGNQVTTQELLHSEATTVTPSALLTSISLNNVTDFYWERRSNSQNSAIIYYLKYPFSNDELERHVDKWSKKYEHAKNELDSILNRALSFKSPKDIETELRSLRTINPILKGQYAGLVKERISAIDNFIGGIEIEIKNNRVGEVQVFLKHMGQSLKFDRPPKITGKGLHLKEITEEEQSYKASFDLVNTHETNLNASVEIAGRTISRSIDVNAYQFEILGRLSSAITVVDHGKDYYQTGDVQFIIPLELNSNTKVVVEQVHIQPIEHSSNFWTGRKTRKTLPSNTITKINQKLVGKGLHHIEFWCRCNLNKQTLSSSKDITINGYVTLRSLIDGHRVEIPFQNIEMSSNW